MRKGSIIQLYLQLCLIYNISLMHSHHPSLILHKQPDLMSLEQKQRHLVKNKSPRRTRDPTADHDNFFGYIDQGEGEVSSSSELGSLNDSSDNSEGEGRKQEGDNIATPQGGQACEFTIKVQMQRQRRQDENIILLYVIKLSSNKAHHVSERMAPFEYFKMRLDCTKCSTESENNEDLRKFRRRVKRKLGLNDNFKIFNYLGHPINEDELSFLNQGGTKQAVVHVSSNSHFDYDIYMKLFHEIKKLGEGGFGQVILGQHIITKEQYAIKSIYPTVFKADEVFKAYKEAQVLQNLRHQNIIKLFNVIQLRDTKLVLFMEHLTGGSLKEHLDSIGGKLLEKEAQSVMYEIGNALNYCHQRSIVHRDIKLENIMLRERGDIGNGLVIIDFGIAGKLQKSNEQHHEGTVRYVPPELITGTSYKADQAFDVWSLGILLYRMVYGCFPFDGATLHDIRQSISNYKMKEPDTKSDVSDTCFALIRLMLNREPTKRPKLSQLIQHEWFTKNKLYQQQHLMQQTVYQQSTLMGFFKEELRQIEQSKEEKQQAERKSIKIVINDQELGGSSLTREPSYLGGISHLLIPNSREKRNLNIIEMKSSKKFMNLSPSPNIIRVRQTFKFQGGESGDYQSQIKRLPKEESISSLNIKKQQLSEMRNFIESTVKSSSKDFKKELVTPIETIEQPQKRRNMNVNSLLEAKSIQASKQVGGNILPKPSSLTRMINQGSKPPTRFDVKSRSSKKQDPVYIRFQNDLKKSKLGGIMESNSKQRDNSIEMPEIMLQSPLRADSGSVFGFQMSTFEPEYNIKRNETKQQSHLKSLNASTIHGKVVTSLAKNHAPSQIGKSKEFSKQNTQPLINPLIVKQHEYKKFLSKAPSQLQHDVFEPVKVGSHQSQISILSFREQLPTRLGNSKIMPPSTVKARDGPEGIVLPVAQERRQIM